MNAKIVAACEAFSMGDSTPALEYIADGIEWHIVGDRTIDGNEAVKEMCEDAASQGTPNFQNGRVIKGKSHMRHLRNRRKSDRRNYVLLPRKLLGHYSP
jgi:hypothetical protein